MRRSSVRFRQVALGGRNPGRRGLRECRVFFIFASLADAFGLPVCGSSSVGRASAFQAECRRFEPGLPLLLKRCSCCNLQQEHRRLCALTAAGWSQKWSQCGPTSHRGRCDPSHQRSPVSRTPGATRRTTPRGMRELQPSSPGNPPDHPPARCTLPRADARLDERPAPPGPPQPAIRLNHPLSRVRLGVGGAPKPARRGLRAAFRPLHPWHRREASAARRRGCAAFVRVRRVRVGPKPAGTYAHLRASKHPRWRRHAAADA